MEKSPICTYLEIFILARGKSRSFMSHKKSNSGGFCFLYNVCLDYGSNIANICIVYKTELSFLKREKKVKLLANSSSSTAK